MAQYQIMFWKEFPSQVKASDEQETVRRMLPDRFQQAIDGAAMADGSVGSSDYLEGWQWGPKEERAGSASKVVDALVAEFDAAYPKSRLAEMVRAGSRTG